MKCKHCRKEFAETYNFCPYCAEPKPNEPKERSLDEKYRHARAGIGGEAIVFAIFCWIPCFLFAWVGEFVLLFFTALNGEPSEFFKTLMTAQTNAILATIASPICGIVYYYRKKHQSKQKWLIEIQFYEDQTSICPKCGSHDIVLGRKGYDWNKGYWYSVFNIKGGRYLAGMDSRKVIGHCKNCGHKWETNKEWIK